MYTKINENDPAYPTVEQGGDLNHWMTTPGLTIRQQFAMAAMQSLVGLRNYDNQPVYDLNKKVVSEDSDFNFYRNQKHADESRLNMGMAMANAAVFAADCLINALNEHNGTGN